MRSKLLSSAGIIVVVGFGCDDDPRARSTIAMADRLREIAEASEASDNPYASEARVAYLESIVPGPDLSNQMRYRVDIAQQYMNAGRNEDAIARLEEARAIAEDNAAYIPQQFRTGLTELLALAYLRLGEQENCVLDHTSQRCLMPISREAVHQKERGSRMAIELYSEVLSHFPDDRGSRWLLNIAYMTLGLHPDSVPSQWLVPEDVFASEDDVGRFEDIAPQLGLDVVGQAGGAMMEDFNNDGFQDIMVSSWGLRDQVRYFTNEGDGTFVDRTIEAGLEGIVSGLHTVHADYNNDGFADVLVLRGAWLQERHPNSLLRNNGDGTFTDVTEAAGMGDGLPTQTAAWADFDNDGWLDLFVGNETIPPNHFPSQLMRNNGDGTFTDVAATAGVRVLDFVKAVAAGDFDNDGRMDLFVSILGQQNRLFRNTTAGGTISFEDVTLAAGIDGPQVSFPSWFFDYDNDGWLDIFVSGYDASGGDVMAEYLGLEHTGVLPVLYRNNQDGTFTDVTGAAGVDRIMYTMGSNFGDLDNDGFQDFYVGTGEPDFRVLIPNRMFRNNGAGQFMEVTASGGFGHLQKGHGVAFGDIDNDGDQDVYMTIGGAFRGDEFQNALFLNPGHGNAWVTLQLRGTETNRAGIGARIQVHVQTASGAVVYHNSVTTGGSFGASTLQQEMGLGQAKAIDSVVVWWPTSDRRDVHRNVPINAMIRLVEGVTETERIEPVAVPLQQHVMRPH